MNAVEFTLWASLLVNGVRSSELSLKMPKRQIIAIGHTVVLTSWIPMNTTLNSISWYKENSGQVLMYSGRIAANDKYGERVGLMHPKPSSDASMYINNTELSDSGRYTCSVSVSIFGSDKILSGGTDLDVLVPPSTPKCNIIGNQYFGNNVTLTCHSENGKPVPGYTWKRIPSKRAFVFPQGRNVKMGSLTLINLTEAMSGLYNCKAENEMGSASCSIQLNVMLPSNAGIIAGSIIGVLLGMCLIIAIAICFCRHQKKKKAEMEQYLANDIKEDAQAPTGNTWAKAENSDIISKNGTLSSMNSTMHVYKPYPNKPYPKKPPSDTASTITAMGFLPDLFLDSSISCRQFFLNTFTMLLHI
ncbi:hypothetical protein scyTo_0000122 [Scyliorhinus torazame]|uniref:Ig-like domain-containing protein n=1 Tax=Scyliorhinus torazame TaxID=75743 RepID=A0A401NQP9_SCYTO|nr:hypothetical protein [Scyliorhinus torazame]